MRAVAICQSPRGAGCRLRGTAGHGVRVAAGGGGVRVAAGGGGVRVAAGRGVTRGAAGCGARAGAFDLVEVAPVAAGEVRRLAPASRPSCVRLGGGPAGWHVGGRPM
ncbi:hypothetical protein ACFYOT_09550 [Saccharothrix saharensis]|uniref:hypothetical protein n=1 Tax=Saccharothrix saharensis TaxID=571190 RepID=UPI0036C3BD3C